MALLFGGTALLLLWDNYVVELALKCGSGSNEVWRQRKCDAAAVGELCYTTFDFVCVDADLLRTLRRRNKCIAATMGYIRTNRMGGASDLGCLLGLLFLGFTYGGGPMILAFIILSAFFYLVSYILSLLFPGIDAFFLTETLVVATYTLAAVYVLYSVVSEKLKRWRDLSAIKRKIKDEWRTEHVYFTDGRWSTWSDEYLVHGFVEGGHEFYARGKTLTELEENIHTNIIVHERGFEREKEVEEYLR